MFKTILSFITSLMLAIDKQTESFSQSLIISGYSSFETQESGNSGDSRGDSDSDCGGGDISDSDCGGGD